MELRQLEYFCAIADAGSINEAARRLHLSQPPLSYQLRQLEEELKVTLFQRTRRGVELTEAGRLLYDRASDLLRYAGATRQEVAEAGKRRVLRLGLTSTTGHRRFRGGGGQHGLPLQQAEAYLGLRLQTLEEPSLETQSVLIWKKDRRPGPVLQDFLTLLAEEDEG